MSLEVADLGALEATPQAHCFEGEPKTVRLSLSAGDEIAAHSHPGREIVFHVLTGSIVLRLDGEETTLDAGEVARFDGDRSIAPQARADSEALIVLAPRADAD